MPKAKKPQLYNQSRCHSLANHMRNLLHFIMTTSVIFSPPHWQLTVTSPLHTDNCYLLPSTLTPDCPHWHLTVSSPLHTDNWLSSSPLHIDNWLLSSPLHTYNSCAVILSPSLWLRSAILLLSSWKGLPTSYGSSRHSCFINVIKYFETFCPFKLSAISKSNCCACNQKSNNDVHC